MLWQGGHFRDDFSPAFPSWASAAPVVTISPTATNTKFLILTSPCACSERPNWRSWALPCSALEPPRRVRMACLLAAVNGESARAPRRPLHRAYPRRILALKEHG